MTGRIGRWVRRNLVAFTAVFLALTAGAYAVTMAPKNSVTSRSIRNGQVKSADLADTAAAGRSIKVKPNRGTSPTNDPCVRDKTGVFCGYNDGGSSDGQVVNRGHGLAPVTYSKDRAGIVRLSGTPAVTSFQTTLDAFILPKGMRPSKQHAYTVPCGQSDLNDLCIVSVFPNGHVTRAVTTTPFAGFSLDSVSFRAGR